MFESAVGLRYEGATERKPRTRDLKEESLENAAVVRAWGKLGYPRRAKRLHECA